MPTKKSASSSGARKGTNSRSGRTSGTTTGRGSSAERKSGRQDSQSLSRDSQWESPQQGRQRWESQEFQGGYEPGQTTSRRPSQKQDYDKDQSGSFYSSRMNDRFQVGVGRRNDKDEGYDLEGERTPSRGDSQGRGRQPS